MAFPNIITDLINYFERLPGVGSKTAQRLVFYMLNFPDRELEEFGSLVGALKKRTQLCSTCKNISEEETCKICSDTSRNHRQILVVTSPLDVVALERTDYKGVYHVLHGLIDPLSYIGPDDIYLASLVERLEKLVFEVKNDPDSFVEVVLATNAGMEGESTAHYIRDLIREKGFDESVVRITRIGRGLPVGGDIEYADDNTLSRALDSRR
ncbi:recombination protein RecR [candidate division WWE3 bacterium]|nr:recombination protein RecR [candidate division WWE3 bacterium]